MQSIKQLLAIGMCGVLTSAALGQDLVHKAPPQDRPIAIINATIHTISGEVIQSGTVLIKDGVISAVGQVHLRGEPHERLINAHGKHVYPGLIGANTVIGLIEVSSVRATLDYSEFGQIAPEVRAAVSVNPDSTIIPVTRSEGILTVGVMPMGGSIPGRASVMSMDGWTWEDMAIKDDAGLMINWPNMRPLTGRFAFFFSQNRSPEEQAKRRQEAIERIDSAFDDAAAYFAAKKADASVPTDLRWEGMRGAIERHDPVFIRAQELEQIQSAVSWAAARDLNTVIVGGRDAYLATELLLKHDVGVIVAGTHRMPRRNDSDYDEAFRLPSKLEAAGVRWCMATAGGSFSAAHERRLGHNAALAVAYGLSPEAGIRSITLAAAELLGVGDKLGSIEVGKAATIIVTDGNPLELTTNVEHAFIDGREITLWDKHKALDEKYREKYRQLGAIKE